jgi:hypothetical protein
MVEGLSASATALLSFFFRLTTLPVKLPMKLPVMWPIQRLMASHAAVERR